MMRLGPKSVAVVTTAAVLAGGTGAYAATCPGMSAAGTGSTGTTGATGATGSTGTTTSATTATRRFVHRHSKRHATRR